MTSHPSFCSICKKILSEHTDRELVNCASKMCEGEYNKFRK